MSILLGGERGAVNDHLPSASEVLDHDIDDLDHDIDDRFWSHARIDRTSAKGA